MQIVPPVSSNHKIQAIDKQGRMYVTLACLSKVKKITKVRKL